MTTTVVGQRVGVAQRFAAQPVDDAAARIREERMRQHQAERGAWKRANATRDKEGATETTLLTDGTLYMCQARPRHLGCRSARRTESLVRVNPHRFARLGRESAVVTQ